MRRREFITLVGGAAAVWPFAARAQQPAMPTVGFLGSRSAEADTSLVAALLQGLKETGYIQGQNVAIEYRWANGQYDRLPALAADLARHPVAVIAAATSMSAVAAKAATRTIPIVFAVGDDPVKDGLVASLNQPGGNLTGLTSFSVTLWAKRLGLMREIVPSAVAMAVLVNPANPTTKGQLADLGEAARTVGVQIQVVGATSDREIETAFATIVQHRANALLIGTDAFLTSRRGKIVALALRHALPTMHTWREVTVAGGLMSYGSSQTDEYRQVGIYIGKILKGAKPADLPVVQPTKFELVINLKTAKALSLDVPPSLLARADEVIE